MNNRERLFDLISEYKLEKREIAELVKVTIELVENWMVSHESHHFEEMPDMAIELLELKLKDRSKPDDNS
jgi:hypothetical protein